jgi:hypothetical protein
VDKMAKGPIPVQLTDEDLANWYSHHHPKGDQTQRYERIRAKCLETAGLIRDLTPGCYEQMRAFSALREAMMWANAGIACNE